MIFSMMQYMNAMGIDKIKKHITSKLNEFSTNGDFYEDDEVLNPKQILRILRRFDTLGTFGDIIFPSGLTIPSLELPYRNNEQDVSCIPTGLYPVIERASPIVERTSKGKYKTGYEICDVPNRSFIMFHIGNFLTDTNGCVLTGTTPVWHNGLPTVWESGKAFDLFMNAMRAEKITHVLVELSKE